MAVKRHLRELERYRFIFRRDGKREVLDFFPEGKNDIEREHWLDETKKRVQAMVLEPGVEFLITVYLWREA